MVFIYDIDSTLWVYEIYAFKWVNENFKTLFAMIDNALKIVTKIVNKNIEFYI